MTMRISGSALLAFCLLGTVPGRAETSKSEMEVIIDCSGSMLEPIPGGTAKKIDVAKESLGKLIEQVPEGTRFGLRAFGHRVAPTAEADRGASCKDIELLFPIGNPDRAAMKKRVQELNCLGMTPLALSLEGAAKDFGAGDIDRTLVLLTDGQETCGGDPVAVARRLAEGGLKIVVNVIGFGVDAGTSAKLQEVAVAGHGTYYAANDQEGLSKSLEKAAAPVAQPKEPPKPDAKSAFVDEFDGDKLGEAWERLNPDDERFLVETGHVLIMCRPRGYNQETKQEVCYNSLRLKRALPENFEATFEFEAEPCDD